MQRDNPIKKDLAAVEILSTLGGPFDDLIKPVNADNN